MICAGAGADRDRRRDAEEDQQRRHQEAAADAEQPDRKPTAPPSAHQREEIDRDLGDRKVDVPCFARVADGKGGYATHNPPRGRVKHPFAAPGCRPAIATAKARRADAPTGADGCAGRSDPAQQQVVPAERGHADERDP